MSGNERKENLSVEEFTVKVTDAFIYDRLYILSAEYSVSMEYLVNVAVRHLLDDVDFVRKLRTGKTEEA